MVWGGGGRPSLGLALLRDSLSIPQRLRYKQAQDPSSRPDTDTAQPFNNITSSPLLSRDTRIEAVSRLPLNSFVHLPTKLTRWVRLPLVDTSYQATEKEKKNLRRAVNIILMGHFKYLTLCINIWNRPNHGCKQHLVLFLNSILSKSRESEEDIQPISQRSVDQK